MDPVNAPLTAAQKLLVAARKLEDDGFKPFTAEALAVRAWKLYPEQFGLRGFKDLYPDSNATYTMLMGGRSLVARGWLIKEAPKTYSLGKQGREETDLILSDKTARPLRRALGKIALKPELETWLTGCYVCTAYRRYADGMRREITYKDAQAFWRLRPETSGKLVDTTVALTGLNLKAVEATMPGDSIELSTGMSVSRNDLNELRRLDEWLQEAFGRKLREQRQGAFRRVG